ncbi:hypothetical protein D3C73_1426660 [compost metagenome]
MHEHGCAPVQHRVTGGFSFFLREQIVLQLAQIDGQCYRPVIFTVRKRPVIIKHGEQGDWGTVIQGCLPQKRRLNNHIIPHPREQLQLRFRA